MRGITDTVKHLLIINVLMFIGSITIGNGDLFYRLFSIYFPLNENFRFWQIITHMFMHIDIKHIFFNMFLLWMFGTMVETALGRTKFLFLFISCGLGATLLPFIIDYFQITRIVETLVESGLDKNTIMETLRTGQYNTGWEAIIGDDKLQTLLRKFNGASLGASGAVMGVLAAFGFMFPNQELMLLFPPIPIKAKYLITGMIGADLLAAIFTGTPLLAGSNIGYVAHVGGALTGLLIVWIWKKNQFDKHRWN